MHLVLNMIVLCTYKFHMCKLCIYIFSLRLPLVILPMVTRELFLFGATFSQQEKVEFIFFLSIIFTK